MYFFFEKKLFYGIISFCKCTESLTFWAGEFHKIDKIIIDLHLLSSKILHNGYWLVTGNLFLKKQIKIQVLSRTLGKSSTVICDKRSSNKGKNNYWSICCYVHYNERFLIKQYYFRLLTKNTFYTCCIFKISIE